MRYIWWDKSLEYLYYKNIADKMSAAQLVEIITKDFDMDTFHNGKYSLSKLMTNGCQYHIRKDGLSGCSMCNLHNTSYKMYAYMSVLKAKDKIKYVDVMRNMLVRSRGDTTKRNIHEFIFNHNFLNKEEVPEEFIKIVLKSDQVYLTKPFVYEFETSPESINEKHLELICKYIGKNRKVWFRMGVECSDAIIRKYWLNKGTTNTQIKNAINVCKNMGIGIKANLLVGIPGFTEENSIKVAKDSILWLKDLGIDMIILNILARKKNTLQWYLFHSLCKNENLLENGIVDGQHTGLPWLFSCLRILNWIYKEKVMPLNKITFGQFVPDYIAGANATAYNEKINCKCKKEFEYFIQRFAFQPNKESLLDLCVKAKFDPCYEKYNRILDKQKQIDNIKNNLKIVAISIAKEIWPITWEKYYNEFVADIQKGDL